MLLLCSLGSPLILMQSLPTVLAQSVMRCLASKDIIALARCSCTLMHAANDPFAWSLSLLHINSTHVDAAISAQSRLLRHAPTYFLSTPKPMSPGHHDLSDAEKIPVLSLLLLLHGLDVQGMDSLIPQHRLFMLRQPGLRQLRSLKLWNGDSRGSVDEATLAALTAMPHLSSLKLSAMEPGADWWSGLASMPSLTSLIVTEVSWFDDGSTVLSHVARCAHLRHLQTVGSSAALDGGRFGAFFSGPHMSRLQSLVLNNFHAGEFRLYLRDSAVLPTDDDFAVAFDALQDLRSLHLLGGSHHDLLLKHLPRARSLCELRLLPQDVDRLVHDRMPSFAVLSMTLDAMPALRCELDLALQRQGQAQIDFSPIAKSMQRFGDRFQMTNMPVHWQEGPIRPIRVD